MRLIGGEIERFADLCLRVVLDLERSLLPGQSEARETIS